MLQLKNQSPFAPAMALFPDRDGVDTLYLVIKGTFTLTPTVAVAENQAPAVMADEYYGAPATSSLKLASELHIGKPGTDVILIGQAWAPAERPATDVLVTVSVAGRTKAVRVLGDRVWTSSTKTTAPKPFESMPLVFERAFGGTHQEAECGPILAEERNPVGVGFRGKRSADDMIGQRLPNLEDPRALLQQIGDCPAPACFGFVAPSWLPRRAFAGTYDEAWEKGRAPYLPKDFDPRFFHCAAPELTFETPLTGGEPVQIAGASREGLLRFDLPTLRPRAKVKIAGATESPTLSLETVLIEPDENRLCLTWRGSAACDKKALRVEQIDIEADGPGSTAGGVS